MKEPFSSTAFRLMAMGAALKDPFGKRVHFLKQLGIEAGMHVVDYGCGTGAYIPLASRLVGPEGLVTALDSHPLAIQSVNEKAFRKGLTNVMGRLVKSESTPLEDASVHIIFALDMFYMVKNPKTLLKEMHRILTPEGFLFLDPVKLSRTSLIKAIKESRLFLLDGEVSHCFRLRPVVARL